MKPTVIALVLAAALIGATVVFSRGGAPAPADSAGSAAAAGGNVSIVDGKQVIDITVKGGYSPRTSVAKAGIPTVLRFKTDGSYDCSSGVRIPSLNISEGLPASGVTDVDVGAPGAGQLAGTCSMGMYRFEVNFQA